jgi:uncharacterized protein (DUF362 family)
MVTQDTRNKPNLVLAMYRFFFDKICTIMKQTLRMTRPFSHPTPNDRLSVMTRFSRRAFIQSLAAASAWAGGLVKPGESRAQAPRPRVVTVIDGRAWIGDGWGDADLDAATVRAMLERALAELTGTADPNAALRALFPSITVRQQRYGIKVNTVNRDLPSHPKVARALAELLVEAGADPARVTVFDRSLGELTGAGYPRSGAESYRLRGCDAPGVGFAEPAFPVAGTAVRFSDLLSDIDTLISLPVLKEHPMAGVTLSLKNHFGSIDQPMLLHARGTDGSPAVAELCALAPIRNKIRLSLIDALFGSYRSGLGGRPDFAPMALIVSTDPVAADAVGQALINARRGPEGLALRDAGHIRSAARLALGVADLPSIERVEIVLAPAIEKAIPWENLPGCGG